MSLDSTGMKECRKYLNGLQEIVALHQGRDEYKSGLHYSVKDHIPRDTLKGHWPAALQAVSMKCQEEILEGLPVGVKLKSMNSVVTLTTDPTTQETTISHSYMGGNAYRGYGIYGKRYT